VTSGHAMKELCGAVCSRFYEGACEREGEGEGEGSE
jgi:hypothetical protein